MSDQILNDSVERNPKPDSVSSHSRPTYSGPIQRIAFLFAMEAEAKPFIEALSLQECTPPAEDLPIRSFAGKAGTLELYVSLNGKDARHGIDRVCTEPAMLNAYLTCSHFHPDLLINAGTAGGFSERGGNIGDVYVSSGSVVYHDHRIPLPKFKEYGEGMYPTVPTSNIVNELKLKPGRVSTGNSLDASQRDLELLADNNADVKEMEAAAIAQVADDQEIAFLAIKSITDLVDCPEDTAEVFMKNLATASQNLQEKLCAFVDYLKSGKRFEDL